MANVEITNGDAFEKPVYPNSLGKFYRTGANDGEPRTERSYQVFGKRDLSAPWLAPGVRSHAQKRARGRRFFCFFPHEAFTPTETYARSASASRERLHRPPRGQ